MGSAEASACGGEAHTTHRYSSSRTTNVAEDKLEAYKGTPAIPYIRWGQSTASTGIARLTTVVVELAKAVVVVDVLFVDEAASNTEVNGPYLVELSACCE